MGAVNSFLHLHLSLLQARGRRRGGLLQAFHRLVERALAVASVSATASAVFGLIDMLIAPNL
ncbi:MAG: hypothetical protein WDN04_10240 [Rhodospirillales bacterium]